MGEISTYATHFCGLGGACWGLEMAGLKCNLAVDNWPVAVEYREKNLGHKALCIDLADYEPKPEHAADVLWTSPPCQSFSTCARDKGYNKQDKRNNLFLVSLEYTKEFNPKFVILENVEGLLTHDADKQGNGTFARMQEAFRGIGYHVEFNILSSEEFGLPQSRNRIFMVCSRDGEKGLIPKPPQKKMLFGEIMEHGMVQYALGGDTYKTIASKVERTGVEITVVGPEDVFPTITCGWGGGVTRKKVAVLDKFFFKKNGKKHEVPFLRHPTVIEGIRAQGFPENWKMPASESDAWKLIGNAVSSPVSQAIANHLKAISRGESPPFEERIWSSRCPEYVKDGPPPKINFDEE